MTAPYPQVVLFGDSLLQGAVYTEDGFSLQAALQEHCLRRYDVINRGLSGYNTSQALELLPRLFPAPSDNTTISPTFVPHLAYLVVLLGANDAALPNNADPTNQHVDLSDYEANLRAIITHPNILAHRPGKIIVVTPPPLDGIRLGEYERAVERAERTSRQARVTATYAEAARRVAQNVPGTVVIDLWTILMEHAVKRTPGFNRVGGDLLGDEQAGSPRGYLASLLSDGLHLTGEAYRIFFTELCKHIDGQSAEGDNWVCPPWREAPWLAKEHRVE